MFAEAAEGFLEVIRHHTSLERIHVVLSGNWMQTGICSSNFADWRQACQQNPRLKRVVVDRRDCWDPCRIWIRHPVHRLTDLATKIYAEFIITAAKDGVEDFMARCALICDRVPAGAADKIYRWVRNKSLV